MPSRSTGEPLLPVGEILGMDSGAWHSAAQRLGHSRQGRPLVGVETGRGATLVTLIGGCHADEPVGPELLDRLAGFLVSTAETHPLKQDFVWRLVPHVNPDGEVRNRAWTERRIAARDHRGEADLGFELEAYLGSVMREPPGDDIEFGFPSKAGDEVRPENRAVADFLCAPIDGRQLPIRLHGSFHGMGLAPGPWFLTEEAWTGRTAKLRERMTATVADMGYRLFDVERHGEKGFHRIAPGFSTRPDSAAMRRYFEERGRPGEAAKFLPSSMELARSTGGDALTFVTEMPLFLTPSLPHGLVERARLEEVRSELLEAQARGSSTLAARASDLGVVPMPIRDQMRLQLALLEEALRAL